LYHGTNLANAESIKQGALNRVPNYELARQICSRFNTSLETVYFWILIIEGRTRKASQRPFSRTSFVLSALARKVA